MTKETEALKLAREALKRTGNIAGYAHEREQAAIAAIDEVLAQPPLPVQDRQPLTDEQIRQCFRDLYAKNENWLAYARAVEAAHNIGAKP